MYYNNSSQHFWLCGPVASVGANKERGDGFTRASAPCQMEPFAWPSSQQTTVQYWNWVESKLWVTCQTPCDIQVTPLYLA